MRGIKKLTMYSREVSFVNSTSRLDLRAPDLQQSFPTLPRPSDKDDRDGDDGKHGVHGPIGRVLEISRWYSLHTKEI